jgi:hypothetical protein
MPTGPLAPFSNRGYAPSLPFLIEYQLNASCLDHATHRGDVVRYRRVASFFEIANCREAIRILTIEQPSSGITCAC